MLNGNALKLLKPNEKMLTVSVRDGLVVIETGTNWFALTKDQAITLIKTLVERVNGMA